MRIAARIVLVCLLAVATCPMSACTPVASSFSSTGASAFGGSGSGAGSYAAPSASSGEITARATSGASDTQQASELTNYFQHHRLPLVGVKIVRDASDNRSVVLYGFTATTSGRLDAANKARQFLGDPNATIDNRIIVRPELANSNPTAPPPSASTGAGPASESTLPGYANQQRADTQAYENQGNQIQQYQQQGNAASLTPMLGIAAMIAGALLGGSSYGTYGGSPYGGYPYGGYGPSYPGGSGFSFGSGFPF